MVIFMQITSCIRKPLVISARAGGGGGGGGGGVAPPALSP